MYDLILKQGRVIDPHQRVDEVLDVAVDKGKIVCLNKCISEKKGKKILNVKGKIIAPGLIDLHTHIYWGGTSLGIKVDSLGIKSGVTTFVDAGSSGAGNFIGFEEFIVKNSLFQIFVFLNISYPGIIGFSKKIIYGESQNIELLDKNEAIEMTMKYPKIIKGIKVRVSETASGSLGIIPLSIALEVAEEIKKPVMVHIGKPPPDSKQVISLLRKGDIITHSFRADPNGLLDQKGCIVPQLQAARQRGVIVDIGHGKGGFSFDTAGKMIAQGFFPDTISSDVHVLSIDGPVYDLPTTMSKMLNLGMSLNEVIYSTTYKPALVLGEKNNIGHLMVGSIADISVLELIEGKYEYIDGCGEKMVCKKRLFPRITCKGGNIFKSSRHY